MPRVAKTWADKKRAKSPDTVTLATPDMTQMGWPLSQKFARQSAEALADMKVAGAGHVLDDVRVYFSQLKKHRKGQCERPAMLKPKTMC